jgi:hypothetical protein
MSEKTAAQKGRVEPGSRITVLNRVPGVVESLGLRDVSFLRSGQPDLVFVFARTCKGLEADMPRAVGRLGPASVLWVFFRKGSKQAGLDMNRNTVWSVAQGLGMRPLGIVAVDDKWSAFRLRPARGAEAAKVRSGGARLPSGRQRR